METEIKLIPISSIIIKENIRSQVDKAELAELADSIRSGGLHQAIGVKKNGKDKYELIYGNRRLEACKQLDFKEIKASIYPADIDERAIRIVENMQRKDITPLGLALAIKNYQSESKLTLSDIAQLLGKTLRQVSQINKLNDLIELLQKLLSNGNLELDAALFIARCPETEQKEFYSKHGRDDRIIINDAKNYFEKRINKLKTFPWPLDKKFTGLPQCNQCPDRTSQQNVLFPPDEAPDDTCLNRKCMEKKITINLKEKIVEAKKNGKVILVRTSYYPNYRYSPDDSQVYEKDNLRQAGKDDKDFFYGVIVASDSLTDIGQVHKYVMKKNSSDSSRSSKSKIENLSPELQKKRRLELYNRKKDLLLFPMSVDISKEINNQIKSLEFKNLNHIPNDAMSIIADYVIDRANFQLTEVLEKIWNPDKTKDKKDLKKIFMMLIAAATYYDGLENAGNYEFYSGSDQYRRLREFVPVLGIDLKAIEAKIKPKYDEKVTSLKERFIARNKFDPEAPGKKKNKKGVK